MMTDILKTLEKDLGIESKRTPKDWHIGHLHDEDIESYSELENIDHVAVAHVFNRRDEPFVCHAANTYRNRIEALKIAIECVKRYDQIHESTEHTPASDTLKAIEKLLK